MRPNSPLSNTAITIPRMISSFDTDKYPGRPRVLFIGPGDSTHTHAWVDLLENEPFNVRVFIPPGLVSPPESWKVKTYITAYERGPLNPSTHIIHTFQLDVAEFYFRLRRDYHIGSAAIWVLQVRGGPELALHRLMPEHESHIRAALSQCDQMVADNQQNYDYALKLGLKQNQLSSLGVVPGTGGIDVDRLAGSWHGNPSERHIVLWPKAYECPQSKALPVLEALKLTAGRMPPCEFHMLAVTPEVRMWFQTLPDDIRERCYLNERTPREQALGLMAASRIMLAPSLADGVPNAMYEAMAAGAFPVVSPLETILPLVKDEQNVLFARNLYPEEIATALIRAMTDDKLVDDAARRNLELVSRIANRNEVRERVVKFYESLANGGRGSH